MGSFGSICINETNRGWTRDALKSCLLMAPWPADMMWAYVSGAVMNVCGVSAGRSGRTFVPRTRNLKVQMSPPALCGRWYSVAPRREINKWPLVYFWFVFRVLAPKCCTCWLSCSTAELSFWDIKHLRVHCRATLPSLFLLIVWVLLLFY